MQGAEVILADEPVASLDPATADRVMATLRDLNRRDGITVIASLHQVDLARRWCDRVIALSAGAVVYDGPVADLDDARLAVIYASPSAPARDGSTGTSGGER